MRSALPPRDQRLSASQCAEWHPCNCILKQKQKKKDRPTEVKAMTNILVENSNVWKYSTMGVTVVRRTTNTQLTMAPTQEGVLRRGATTTTSRRAARAQGQWGADAPS